MVLSKSCTITIVKDVYQFSKWIARKKTSITASHNKNMIHLTIENNYIQSRGVRKSDVVSGSVYMHMFSSA